MSAKGGGGGFGVSLEGAHCWQKSGEGSRQSVWLLCLCLKCVVFTDCVFACVVWDRCVRVS